MKLDESDLQAVLGRVAELAKQTLAGTPTPLSPLSSPTAPTPSCSPAEAGPGPGRDPIPARLRPLPGSRPVLRDRHHPRHRRRDPLRPLARHALAAGVRSSLSVALPLQEAVVEPLNIYATQPATFDRDAVELARTFAGYAAVAIANARLYQITATLAENMRRAMETRAVIEQAKGIIVAQQHCTPEHAFDLLTRLSQTTHRKLRDCAADLVASTAEDP